MPLLVVEFPARYKFRMKLVYIIQPQRNVTPAVKDVLTK